jgi:transcriptional regulator GlxA family with amidase domain
MASTYRVGVVAYRDCLATEVFSVVDLLMIAAKAHATSRRTSKKSIDVRVVACERGPVIVSGGFSIEAARWSRRFDLLVVPGFALDPHAELDDALSKLHREIRFLASAHAAGVRIASVCVGAFLLGEAGLLDGRRATTSWLFADQLSKRFPECRVEPTRMQVDDGLITTTAAFSAVNDLAIGIVRRHLGNRTARLTSRIALVSEERSSQSPYVDQPALTVRVDPFARAVRSHLDETLHESYDLAALALAMNTSTRTLLRRFRHETGTTPLRYLQQRRIQRAKQLIELGRSTVDVMVDVGYVDAAAFRRLFIREVGISPGAYRRQFGRIS